MVKRSTFAVAGVAVFSLAFSLYSQVTGSISGTITDQSGAVVPGASVRVISQATGAVITATANSAGVYVAPSLGSGEYRVEVTYTGFRQSVVNNVKVDVGLPTVLDVKLEVGSTGESVQVSAEGAAVILNTATIATTITGKQITDLPLTSRDALDLATLMPGFATGGTPRAGSFNALPKGSINITMDGVNTQDNLLKSAFGGGFFTYVRPRVDAIDEVTVSTATPGAEAAGEGAIQIKFVTRRGTNEWHGGLFWYVRNDALNANYWFNNLNGIPRQVIKLNQMGGRIGGPIIKNKLFIFGVYEEFRLPESRGRTANIFKSEVLNGNFSYVGTDGVTRTANLLQLAASQGLPSTPDPFTRSVLQRIDQTRSAPGAGIAPFDPFRDNITWNNSAQQIRRFPTGRMDWNITDKLQWEGIWNYNYFLSSPDTLNGRDAVYPGLTEFNGAPTQAGQYSNRFTVTTALRYAVTPTVNNELRFGWQGGTASFAPEIGPGPLFPNNYRIAFPLISTPTSQGLRSDRNTPVFQLSDNLGWQKGKHTMSFGINYSRISYWTRLLGNALPTISMGITGTDPATNAFTPQTMPGLNAADQANARAVYALLVGRISGVSGTVNVDENLKKYVPFGNLTNRVRQQEWGIYFADTWRIRQGLTLNYGLRYELQFPPEETNGISGTPGYEGVFGVSGPDNLFAPGSFKGSPTVWREQRGRAWNLDKNNFAPSLGFSWSPNSDNLLLKSVFGKGGAFRAGYGISFNREGLSNFTSYGLGNPGPTATAQLVADVDFPAGSLALRNPLPNLRTFPAQFGYPLAGNLFRFSGRNVLWFDPNLQTPYVQSWSAGIQRELPGSLVLEARYVGNKATHLWRGINHQEANIIENGFLEEFKIAKANYDICAANRVACTGSATGALRFDNRGLPGQRNTPIFSAAFAGLALASGFTNGTFINDLVQGGAGTLANRLATSNAYMSRLESAGFPSNFFLVNPELAGGGAWLLRSNSNSTYHSAQLEVRRRFSQGLLISGNYTFSKGLTDYFADSADSSSSFVTLRNFRYEKGISPYDIRHQFKANWIYELPFGYGKRWTPSNGILNHIVGGWQWHGIGRMQTGRPYLLTGGFGTLTQNGAGVVTSLTRKQLQDMTGIFKQPNRRVYFFDPAKIGPDGRPLPDVLQPASEPGVLGQRIFLYGPEFIRFDLSAIKKTKIGERWDVELRAEFLNAFNNANFLVGGETAANVGVSVQSTAFGQTTTAYRDISTTNDPGGRIVQLVLRINF